MKEYIERAAAMDAILGLTIADPAVAQYADAVCYHLQNLPAADVVPKAAYEQVAWERDLAVKQLHEDYGVGLGGKKNDAVKVVRCYECRLESTVHCPMVHKGGFFGGLCAENKADDFCSYGEMKGEN